MADNPDIPSTEQQDSHNLPTNDSTPQSDCHHINAKRNLVLCIDGTENEFGDTNTNVIELYNLLLKGEEDHQRTWYNSGIGTYARRSWNPFELGRVLYNKIDSVVALSFETTVLAGYKWLSDNYEHGDCIFLFGFSRGAFQVRVLSAMIDKVGLIYKGNEAQIPFAFALYADPESDESEKVTQVGSLQNRKTSRAERFKEAFSYQGVKVHFVGVWDTVSSVGLTRGGRAKSFPRTVDGMKHVCYFRHALALDERRVKFLPEYAYGSAAKPSTPSPLVNPVESELNIFPQTLEVWFAGTHSDIGGGNVENKFLDNRRPPLRWMVYEAVMLGLRTAQFELKLSFKKQEKITIKESLYCFWWLPELFPFKRSTYSRRASKYKSTTYIPHLGSPRKIHEGQKFHTSFMLAQDFESGAYIPKARPALNDNETITSFWKSATSQSLEYQLSDYVGKVVKNFINALQSEEKYGGIDMMTFYQSTALWPDGRETVRDAFYEAIAKDISQNHDNKSERMTKLLGSTTILAILSTSSPKLKLTHSLPIRSMILGLDIGNDNGEFWRAAKEFVEQCTIDTCVHILKGHEDSVSSVVFSPDGTCLVSGSEDKTIRIWNMEEGKELRKIDAKRFVNSVAFLPDNESAHGLNHIISNLDHSTLCLWDVETGKKGGQVFNGHEDIVTSVASSLDGTRVVSSSLDRTIRIWDPKTGGQVGAPINVDSCKVYTVAFSPEGERIVSGADDGRVRIWDTRTGAQVGLPLEGHIAVVRSVAFSRDGTLVVSSSLDETIRIWDPKTGMQVLQPEIRGHTDWVNSIAFSNDGNHIVSGSDDHTVRIWNSRTGKQVALLEGHTDYVNSVAISSDGTRVISGSADKTIRVWDIKLW